MKTHNSSPPRIILAALCAFLFAAATASAQVNVNIGTIANNEAVTITYEVTIADPLVGVTQISSQGTISGGNFSAFSSDDPETTAANDATITLLQNELPVVDLNGATAGQDVTVVFTEQTPELIAPAGTVSDADGDDITSLTATLTARLDGDFSEYLGLNSAATTAASSAGLAVNYFPLTGVLSISGSASAATYQILLQGILYTNLSDDPFLIDRSVTVVANDPNPSASQTTTITIQRVNDAPVVTSGDSINYSEQAAPVAISTSLTVTDVDSATLAGAAISISSGFVAGDVLGFIDQNGIAGNYDSGTGVLGLTGVSSLANYQTALRSITFSSTSDNPTASGASPSRTVTFVVTDGTTPSSSAASTINVTAVADTPSVADATTSEDTQTTSGLVISRNAGDGTEVTHFKITAITGGTLFMNDGTTAIAAGDFITVAEGNAGLKFTPGPNLSNPGTSFSINLRASLSASDAGLGGAIVVGQIFVTPVADTPSVTGATTAEDTQTTSGLVISRNAADSTEVTHFKITGIVGGTLFKNDGTTPISNNDFITFAEGNAGLKFTPAADLNSPGTTFGFNVQASISAVDAGLGGAIVPASIMVNAVNDNPVAVTDTISRPRTGNVKVKIVTLLQNDTDAENQTISFTGVASPTPGGATVAVSGEWILYTPNGTTADTFTYAISDGNGGIANGTVNVTIQDEDTQASAPTAIQIQAAAGGGVDLFFDGIPNRTYKIQSKVNVNDPWSDIGDATSHVNGRYTFHHASGDPLRLYRYVYRP